jgi:hypothetical protein
LARKEFPDAAAGVRRYATLAPRKSAILVHYRGPAVPESGEMPDRGLLTHYLIEVEEYQKPEIG